MKSRVPAYALILSFALVGLSIPSFAEDQSTSPGVVVPCKNQPPPEEEGCKCPGGVIDQLRGTLKEEFKVFNLCPPACVRSGYGLPLPSVPKALVLTYCNRYSTTASFGFGWSSILDCRVRFGLPYSGATDYAVVVSPEGSNLAYYKVDGVYVPPSGTYATLAKNPDGSWLWEQTDGVKYNFDSDGYLVSVVDRNGIAMSLAYSQVPVAAPEPVDYFDDFENNPHLAWASTDALPGADPEGCRYGSSGFADLDVAVTANPAEVISGAYSVKATMRSDATWTWNDILVSSSNMFRPSTTYRVSFKYKCLQAIGNGYLQAGFWNQDDSYYIVSLRGAKNIHPATGEEGTAEFTYTTTDLQHTYLYIRMIRNDAPNVGSIVIDDILVEEIGSVLPATRKAVTTFTDLQGRNTVINYGTNGQASSLLDPFGRTFTFGYSPANDLVTIAAPGGRTTDYTYDDTHNMVSKTDPMGNIENFIYFRGSDSIISTISPDGGIHTFQREMGTDFTQPMKVFYTDPNGNTEETALVIPPGAGYTYKEVVKYIRHPDGTLVENTWTGGAKRLLSSRKTTDGVTGVVSTWAYTYTANGKIASSTNPKGLVTAYFYDSILKDKVVAEINPLGSITYEYDARGNLLKKTDRTGAQTSYTVDAWGNRTSMTDPNWNTTLYAYEPLGNLAKVTDPGGVGGERTFTYDAMNNNLAATTPLGFTTHFEYNEYGQVTRVVNPDATTQEFLYDLNGNQISKENERGAITQSSHDPMNRLATVTDPLGAVATYEYDPNGNLVKATDRLGNSSTRTYDSRNRLIAETDAEGAVVSYTRDGSGRILTKTDASGTTGYAYDVMGLMTGLTHPDGSEQSFVYDLYGRKTGQVDENGNSTSFTYNARSELVLTVDALGTLANYLYDHNGNLRRTTFDPAGMNIASEAQYDALNRTVKTIAPEGGETVRAYDADSRLIAVTNPNGATTAFAYDSRNRLIKSTDPLAGETVHEYDAAGNRTKVAAANGTATAFAYDIADRPLASTQDPGGLDLVTSRTYDAENRVLTVTDPKDKVTAYTYDKVGRPIRQVDDAGRKNITISFAYDPVGNLLTLTDANNNVTAFAYDSRNRLVRKTHADATFRTFTYDPVGNLIGEVDQNGNVFVNTFDALNRLTSVAVNGASARNYLYDKASRLLSASDTNEGRLFCGFSRSHDKDGRILTETQAIGTESFPVGYAYDPAGNMTGLTYPDGRQVAYAWDADNRLSSVFEALAPSPVLTSKTFPPYARREGGGRGLSEPQRDSFDSAAPAVPYIAYTYDPAGLVVGKTLGNGVEYAASFDAANRQVSSDWQNSHHHSLAGYNYAYDAASNRKYEEKVHDPNNSQLYKYDTVYQVDKFKTGRLNRPKTNIPRPDRTQDWNYDPMGNWRQFRDSVDGLQRRDHNEVNEITEITEFGPRRPRHRPSQTRTALSYDANGNLLDDGEYLYAWDAFNRLVEVRLKRNSRIVGQYFYDAMHRRTRRLANLDHNASLETNVTYVYDGFNCISEISNLQSGITTKSYVWGNDISGGLQTAGGVGGLVAVIQNGSTHYPLYDARGNVTAYTGSSGSIAASFDYLPFGALASSTGNVDAFSCRFSTKPFDSETGLVYYNFRYYSPELGRWMSRDPVGEMGGVGLYLTTKNNHISDWDILGLFLGFDPIWGEWHMVNSVMVQRGIANVKVYKSSRFEYMSECEVIGRDCVWTCWVYKYERQWTATVYTSFELQTWNRIDYTGTVIGVASILSGLEVGYLGMIAGASGSSYALLISGKIEEDVRLVPYGEVVTNKIPGEESLFRKALYSSGKCTGNEPSCNDTPPDDISFIYHYKRDYY